VDAAVDLTMLTAAILGVLTGPWLRGLITAHSVGFQHPCAPTAPGAELPW
jgi:hypothetical protein